MGVIIDWIENDSFNPNCLLELLSEDQRPNRPMNKKTCYMK